MTRDRRRGRSRTLFIVADAAGIPSLALWAPIVSAPDYLVRISANENQVVTSALLQLIMAAAVLELFAELNEEGRTIVVVSHETDIRSIVHRQVTLQDGRVVDDERSRNPVAV